MQDEKGERLDASDRKVGALSDATWSGHNDSRTSERDTDRCARLGCVCSESEIQISGTARGDRF
jgi:hypothetical protein